MYTNDTGPEGATLIPLRNRSNVVRAFAIVDAEDAAWVNRWRWHLDKDGYATRETVVDGRRAHVLLHREILGLTRGDQREGDHRNRNRLDNRRANLLAVPKAGNRQNVNSRRGASSQHRGVYRNPYGKWQAYICINGKSKYLGQFVNEEDAAEAARAARVEHMPYAVD